jgi:hypothetical protein
VSERHGGSGLDSINLSECGRRFGNTDAKASALATPALLKFIEVLGFDRGSSINLLLNLL